MSRNKILLAVLLIMAILFLYNRIFSLKSGDGFLDEMRERK